MKTVIIFNTINRPEMVKTTMVENIRKAGKKNITVLVTNNGGGPETNRAIEFFTKQIAPIHVEVFKRNENIGNSPSLNEMLRFAAEHIPQIGWFAKLDDDIEMPRNWLSEAIKKMQQIETLKLKPGIIGFDWGNLKKDREPFNEKIQCYTPARVFGSWVFPYDVFEQLGYFVELSKYGLWDSEFNHRLRTSGHVNCYLNDYDSKHIDADAGTHSDYRHMKNDELKKAAALYEKVCKTRPARITWYHRKFWENEK